MTGFAVFVIYKSGQGGYLKEGSFSSSYQVVRYANRKAAKEMADFIAEGISDECQSINVVPYPKPLKKRAKATKPGESNDAPAPQYPKPCGLCEKQIESADDTEWHGLGNCVPLCERCMGSGIDPNDNLKITTAEAKELAAMDKRGAKFVQSALSPSEERLPDALLTHEELASCLWDSEGGEFELPQALRRINALLAPLVSARVAAAHRADWDAINALLHAIPDEQHNVRLIQKVLQARNLCIPRAS